LNGDVFWLNKKVERRSDSLCDVAIQKIMSFWTIKTTISPNVKDATWKKIVIKQYDGHATHYPQIP
jgi:hypothetical protein